LKGKIYYIELKKKKLKEGEKKKKKPPFQGEDG